MLLKPPPSKDKMRMGLSYSKFSSSAVAVPTPWDIYAHAVDVHKAQKTRALYLPFEAHPLFLEKSHLLRSAKPSKDAPVDRKEMCRSIP